MRIRLMNIIWAAGGYMVGSGRAQQLWREAQHRLEERQQQGSGGIGSGGRREAQPPPLTPYDAVESTPAAAPMESYTA